MRGVPRSVLVSALACACAVACADVRRPSAEGAATLDAGAPSVDASAVDAGTDATSAADATSATDAGAPPPKDPPLCDPSREWGAATRLPSSTADDDAMSAVTPDERVIAWTRVNGAAREIDWADRASATDPFGATHALDASDTADDRVALSPDGLRLVTVNLDRKGFSERTRASLGDAFGAPSDAPFGNLDGALAAGESYGDPTLAPDDASFYYSRWGSGDAHTIYLARRLFAGDPWAPGAAVSLPSTLLEQRGMRRRPTSVSADLRTIFYDDEVTGHAGAVFFDASFTSFTDVVDLGARSGAQPSADCARLYFSAAGASSVDLFVASKP